MASGLTRFGNDLYTGARSVPFIRLRVIWLSIAAVLMLIALAVPFVRGGGDFAAGFNFGIEFRGGSQFQVSNAAIPDGANQPDASLAEEAVHSVAPDAVVRVSTVGDDGVRVQTDQLTNAETQDVARALEDSYETTEVTSSFVGPTWGADITRQALIGLGVFLVLAMIMMAIYFRTWKMSLAAIVSLFHDLVITVGVYAASGFEITPAAVVGFLTILGFSLYDTVVVFDKIRENTSEMSDDSTRTFGETVNLAVNQTLVRSINTGVVAALPVAAILFIGSFVLGADTLRDISLALLVGTIIGTYSTPFVASPLYVWFRENEPAIAKRDKRVLELREKSTVTA
ncbi:protein translocase subunit SecF [Pseudolysinimonas yzui]|uniref:Protein-export membrane protein SecF n=1 Tax=Pseudolysinimonas yzui TaxID=2708254 RepID=A0A8J3GNW3_9MICO|nr:protein translocase subunit SecF [Pseudolysinimonas yzui]GHF08720.1 protein-export membrane protein SecF [Pseudolysinimonas yzui]